MTIATGPRRRGLLAAVLGLALLLPWIQQGALQHALGHAPAHASLAFATPPHAHEDGGPGHDGACANCVAFAAFLAGPPLAAPLPAVLLATSDDPHLAPVRPAATTAPRAWPNRGPPAAA